jgi:hypothetical protein
MVLLISLIISAMNIYEIDFAIETKDRKYLKSLPTKSIKIK